MLERIAMYILRRDFLHGTMDGKTPEERIGIFRRVCEVDGFPELIEWNIHQYRKRFVEGGHAKDLYFAECYQNLLTKMRGSRVLNDVKGDDVV